MSDLDGDLRLNRTLSRLSNIFPFETSHFHRNINEIEHVKPSFFPSPKTRSRFLLVPIYWIPNYKNLLSHLKLRTIPKSVFGPGSPDRGYRHCLLSRPERWSSSRLLYQLIRKRFQTAMTDKYSQDIEHSNEEKTHWWIEWIVVERAPLLKLDSTPRTLDRRLPGLEIYSVQCILSSSYIP